MFQHLHAQMRDQRAPSEYRTDIDGLRAIAVLAVVAGHIGFGGLGGGFTGVDMFFVISGYLVGGAMVHDAEENGFSLKRYYTRRLRRIVPALLAMLVGTTLLMLAVTLPDTVIVLGRSMLASLAFGANLYFYLTLSYFGGPSSYAPLLPLWSLAVEEQYYLLFPLVVIAIRRFAPHYLLSVTIFLALGSFLFGVGGLHFDPNFAFFLLPSRAWELLIGVLAAGVSGEMVARRALREGVAVVGLAMCLLSFALYRSSTAFPGAAALLPCVGTALLLIGGAQGPTRVGRILAMKPLVFVGLISYSLYLWHWPILLTVKLALPTPLPSLPMRAAIFAASILAGYLSWRFVERPTRSSQFSTRRLIGWTAGTTVALAGVAVALILTDGVPQRFSPAAVRLAAKPVAPDFRAGGCFPGGWNGFWKFNRAGCLTLQTGKTNILLIGDSHAAQYAQALSQTLGPKVHLLRATASGCAPLLSLPANSPLLCTDMSRFLFERYLPTHPVTHVIVGGAWTRAEVPQLALTLNWLRAHGFRVVLIGPGARYVLPLPTLLALASQRGDPTLPQRFRAPDLASLDRAIEALALARGMAYFSPYRVLCPHERCFQRTPDGRSILYDGGHLSRDGAARVIRRFSSKLLAGPVIPSRPDRGAASVIAGDASASRDRPD